MPAALATSESVTDDQSRVISMSRMPSRIESRKSTRDASAYGTRGAVRRSSGVLTWARVTVISRRFARPRRSRTGNLDHLEVRFGCAAVRATPVLGDVVPAGARCDAVLRPPLLLVVGESALHADEKLVVAH